MKRTSRKSFNHRPLCPNSCLHFLETVSDSGESEYGSQEKYGCRILKLLCTKFHAVLLLSLLLVYDVLVFFTKIRQSVGNYRFHHYKYH